MSTKELCRFFGQRVRERRKFLKLSRRELADKSGVSEPTIGRLERNGVATIQVFVKLAIALNSVDTLSELLKSPRAKTFDEYMSMGESAK